MRRRGQQPRPQLPDEPMSPAPKRETAGFPRRPQPRQANPEPMIPASKREAASPGLRISYGGCEWCGGPQRPGGTSCMQCSAREQSHRQRMTAFAEREAELRNQILERRLETPPMQLRAANGDHVYESDGQHVSCPCSCTYTVTADTGVNTTVPSFAGVLGWLKEHGLVFGDESVTVTRNTDECPCKCTNCTTTTERPAS